MTLVMSTIMYSYQAYGFNVQVISCSKPSNRA